VLRAIGRSDDEARGGVRFSLGPATTADEIDAAAAATRRVVQRIRALAGPLEGAALSAPAAG